MNSVKHSIKHLKTFLLFSCLVSDVLRVWTDAENMFDARMRVALLGCLYSWDTVLRHVLISLKMSNEEDVLLDLSENAIEVKSTPKRKGNKVRTRRWTDEETDIREVAKTNQKKSGQGVSENYKSGWIYWDRLQFLIPVISAGKSKDWHKTS